MVWRETVPIFQARSIVMLIECGATTAGKSFRRQEV
jgi:hypothetical protein